MTRKRSMQRWFRSFGVGILFLTLISLSGVVSAQDKDRPSDQDDDIVTSEADGVHTAAVSDWTIEEMENAIPRPLPSLDGTTTLPGTDSATPDGEPGVIPGTPPENTSDLDDVTIDSNEVPSYSRYPYSAVGKLFFRIYGRSYVCSASVVKNNAIWTAGHCVHEGNGRSDGWATDVVFVPQYRNGSAPCGQWRVTNLKTTRQWRDSSSFARDFGGGRVNANINCTGRLGFAYNQGYGERWTAVGYPAGSPFNGSRMIECRNESRLRIDSGNPRPFGIRCNMTGGSSGGPYIIDNDTLNGNVSYGYRNRPNELYSPYFGSAAKSFYDGL